MIKSIAMLSIDCSNLKGFSRRTMFLLHIKAVKGKKKKKKTQQEFLTTIEQV